MATLHPPTPFHRPRVPRAPRVVAPPRLRPARRVPRRRTLAGELALPLGAVAAALVVTALLLTGGRPHTAVALGVLTLLTVLVAALARPLLVPAVALVSWLFYDGFVLNQRSDLAFRQPDRTGLLVLLLAGLVGAGCAAALRAVRRHSAPPDPPR
ncbi:DUF4118 domain-containing protein [Streptomyces sp. NPDC048506]|uniref:DUF4118 domain-containing protein n=1 Tax=Streptomyces sp. NPDC048506 TaxID=3155028 RepID=UPI0034469170